MMLGAMLPTKRFDPMPMHRRALWLVQSMGGTPRHSSSSTSKERSPVAAMGREMIARAHAVRGWRIGVFRSWPALLEQWPHHAVWCEWESTCSGCTAAQGECDEDKSRGDQIVEQHVASSTETLAEAADHFKNGADYEKKT